MMLTEAALGALVVGALVLVIAAPVILILLFARDWKRGELW